MLSSTSSNWMATFALATLCAAKNPSRTASAARANGVFWPGSNNATGTGAPSGRFSAGRSWGAGGAAGPGVAVPGDGTGVTVGGAVGLVGAGVAGGGTAAGGGAVGAG